MRGEVERDRQADRQTDPKRHTRTHAPTHTHTHTLSLSLSPSLPFFAVKHWSRIGKAKPIAKAEVDLHSLIDGEAHYMTLELEPKGTQQQTP